MSSDRIPCVVPFCKRTGNRAKMPDAVEVICGKCSRRAPRRLRLLYRKARRALERGRNSERAWRQVDRLWDQLKAAAIAAAGATP